MWFPTINNLPSKFQPFLLSNEQNKDIKEEIDDIFKTRLKSLERDYIFDVGKWVLKRECSNPTLTRDTHLYRIRKAEKIRRFIQKNHLENHIEVPKKYLYWNKNESRFYVVAEKMPLSKEVAKPASIEIENCLKGDKTSRGQQKALIENAPRRSLTSIQAKSLAELSILGYTDLTYNNLYFIQGGKIAIIDTEPVTRGLKKRMKSTWVFFLFRDMEAVRAIHSIIGIAKLKCYTDQPDALKAVLAVERNLAFWGMSRLITKIAAVTLAIYFTPTITSLIPIAGVAGALKVSFIAMAALKDLILAIEVMNIYLIWGKSCRGLEGLKSINILEDLDRRA